MSRITPGKLSRQQLYEQIRKTSKDEYILEEMTRLGFWEEDQEKPSVSAELIARKGELERELQELLRAQQGYRNPELALEQLHEERKKAARQRREETRQQQNEERFQRARQWYETTQQDIVFLGQGYSAGLGNRLADQERLTAQGLPRLDNATQLAQAMGVSINELRFLSYSRKTAQKAHYTTFLIAKKSGGTRKISAPMPRLKRLQYWILDNILNQIPLHGAAHGFVTGRSIVTNARPHIGAGLVVNMDLKDFFPTITYKRIKGLFCQLGYCEQVATILALLCSEADRTQVELDSETFFVARSARHLPQGAPTSPAISNLICRTLDKRMQGLAACLGFTYTRYADDLTFSGTRELHTQLAKLFWRTQRVIEEEGFAVNPAKTRTMPSGSHQEVTGIVVNEKLSLDRKHLKRFRALLFQIDKDGIEGKHWGPGELIPSIEGYANFVAMVDPGKGRTLQSQVARIKAQHGGPRAQRAQGALNKKRLREQAARGLPPRQEWWMATPPAPPVKESTAAEQKLEKQEQRRQRNTSAPPETAAEESRRPDQSRQHQAKSSVPWWAWLVVGYVLSRLLALLFK